MVGLQASAASNLPATVDSALRPLTCVPASYCSREPCHRADPCHSRPLGVRPFLGTTPCPISCVTAKSTSGRSDHAESLQQLLVAAGRTDQQAAIQQRHPLIQHGERRAHWVAAHCATDQCSSSPRPEPGQTTTSRVAGLDMATLPVSMRWHLSRTLPGRTSGYTRTGLLSVLTPFAGKRTEMIFKVLGLRRAGGEKNCDQNACFHGGHPSGATELGLCPLLPQCWQSPKCVVPRHHVTR